MRQILPSLLLLLSASLAYPCASGPAAYGLQQQKTDGLGAARQHISQGNFSAAIQFCEQAVDKNPDNAAAWLLLGRASQLDGRWEDALGAFGIAGESPAQAALANFFFSKLSAARGLNDDAVEFASAALQAGLPARRLWTASELSELSKTSAFQKQVPRPKTSAQCFDEDVRILHTFYGELPGDTFGWIGRDLGDVDGDGKSDLLISAPFSNEGGASSGKIYVYSGANGELLFSKTGQAGERMGMGIEAAGDMDGDGGIDFLVTNGNSNVMGTSSGRAFVIAGPVPLAKAKD